MRSKLLIPVSVLVLAGCGGGGGGSNNPNPPNPGGPVPAALQGVRYARLTEQAGPYITAEINVSANGQSTGVVSYTVDPAGADGNRFATPARVVTGTFTGVQGSMVSGSYVVNTTLSGTPVKMTLTPVTGGQPSLKVEPGLNGTASQTLPTVQGSAPRMNSAVVGRLTGNLSDQPTDPDVEPINAQIDMTVSVLGEFAGAIAYPDYGYEDQLIGRRAADGSLVGWVFYTYIGEGDVPVVEGYPLTGTLSDGRLIILRDPEGGSPDLKGTLTKQP